MEIVDPPVLRLDSPEGFQYSKRPHLRHLYADFGISTLTMGIESLAQMFDA